MATHEELRDLFSSDPLMNRLEVAICIKARTVLTTGPATAGALAWAAKVLEPTATAAESERMLRFLLAGCTAMTVTQIKETSDEVLDQAVSDAVDRLFI